MRRAAPRVRGDRLFKGRDAVGIPDCDARLRMRFRSRSVLHHGIGVPTFWRFNLNPVPSLEAKYIGPLNWAQDSSQYGLFLRALNLNSVQPELWMLALCRLGPTGT